eukprot:1869298-Rhodomonas_salina.5
MVITSSVGNEGPGTLLSPYALATPCPCTVPHAVLRLRACYAMSGTDLAMALSGLGRIQVPGSAKNTLVPSRPLRTQMPTASSTYKLYRERSFFSPRASPIRSPDLALPTCCVLCGFDLY